MLDTTQIQCLNDFQRMAIYTPVDNLWKEYRANEKGECKFQRILKMYP